MGWKPYIPTIISATATISCIFGANILSKKSQASLVSAYSVLNNYYNEYKKNVNNLLSEHGKDLEHDVIRSKFDNAIPAKIHEGKELFFDYQSVRYFESTRKDLQLAEDMLNNRLSKDGYVCLNDFYEFLGLPKVPYGYQLGWSVIDNDEYYSKEPLKIVYDEFDVNDDYNCTIVDIDYPPSIQYIC